MVVLSGRQGKHCREILKVKVGSVIRLGVKNGAKGEGEVTAMDSGSVTVKLLFDCHSPCKEPMPLIDLIVGLPRPKVFEKVLQTAATMGVGRLIFVCSTRADKAYLSSPKVKADSIWEDLQIGLEQCMSTRFPDVHVYASWAMLLHDLPVRFCHPSDSSRSATRLLVADPSAESTLSAAPIELQRHSEGGVLLAVGPEGGWIPEELEGLYRLGFHGFTIGERILRVEAACVALMAQIGMLLNDPVLRNGLPPATRGKGGASPAMAAAGAESVVRLPIKGAKQAKEADAREGEGEGMGDAREADDGCVQDDSPE
ncbi:unnamed protein product [Vitrella brassicaformis CCMP3155]|uniref:16S rRNA (uracil(1498)-N(3))-methyltransferase n=2 Tax=Vitrella brassicaformis TaxID=1169539 RepID=A0A0G4EC79_VITBC|nr:unnamed protein product [Vitrella brassicaformis CCMP3155]|eukprot:CEL93309.1 unnamed protein product [Vitrella brassicaformis CCMP3155]